jgi:hypothetical protein
MRLRRLFLVGGSAVLVSCSGINSPPEPIQKEVEIKPAAKNVPQGPFWSPVNKTVRQGDIQVEIGNAHVDNVILVKSSGEKVLSGETHLAIVLSLTNVNQNKKVEYQGWTGKKYNFDRELDFATIKDNFGNQYKRIDFGIFLSPFGSVSEEAAIYPGKSIIDVLVFQRPIETASYLDLELPAANYGGEGAIRFRIFTKLLPYAARP